MPDFGSLAASAFVMGIAFSLVQFVWQGALVWLVTVAGLRALRRSPAEARYRLATAGLAVMCLAFGVTAVRNVALESTKPVSPGVSGSAAPAGATGSAVSGAGQSADSAAAGGSSLATALSETLSGRLRPWLPGVFACWAIGVGLLAVRLGGGWLRLRRIVSRGAPMPETDWQIRMQTLARQLGIGRPVRLLRSAAVSVPAVVGWLRPAIIVPVSALAGLAPADLEAILAHELAHIRRADYVVNQLQAAAETLFFYHPAVWWVSRRMRVEREHCCDDIAATRCGDRVTYARALAALEDLRVRTPVLAVGADGGELLARIRRLVQPEVDRSSVASGGVMVGAALLIVGLFVNVAAQSPAPLPPAAAPAIEVVLAPAPASPPIASGGIKGEVKDEDGGTIPGATVSAKTTNGITYGSAVTNARGLFAFENMADGEYEITVSLQGFRTWRARVAVASGATTPVGVRLALGQLAEVVNVRGPASMQVVPPAAVAAPRSIAREAFDTVLPLTEHTGPIRVGGSVREPKKVNHVTPEYPAAAVAAGLTGLVVIEAVIDQTGAVAEARVMNADSVLGEAALAAVRQWRYTPTTLGGVPHAITMHVTVNFSK